MFSLNKDIYPNESDWMFRFGLLTRDVFFFLHQTNIITEGQRKKSFDMNTSLTEATIMVVLISNLFQSTLRSLFQVGKQKWRTVA